MIDSDLAARNQEPVAFETDRKSWNELDQVLLREGRAERHEEIWVTVVGQIRAPNRYVRDNGAVVGGYGHLGVFPAEIVVKRILSVSVKKTPTYDYGEAIRPKER